MPWLWLMGRCLVLPLELALTTLAAVKASSNSVDHMGGVWAQLS